MIRFRITNGENILRFDAPSDELFDHLGSIGILKNIPITSSGEITMDFYSTEKDDKIAEIVCGRLLSEDKISDVNRLCEKLDGMWRISADEFDEMLSENDIRGALNIDKAYENMIREIKQSDDLKM